MPTIQLHSTVEDEYQKQLSSLKLKQYYQRRKVKNKTKWLVIVSLLCIILAAFNAFHWGYFVAIIFWWAMFGLSNLMDETSLNRSQDTLRRQVEAYSDPSIYTSVAFDTENLSLTLNKTPEKTYKISWQQFIGYNNSDDVLLLALANKLSICFTRNEMGSEAFEDFCLLVQGKLPTLKSNFESKKEWWHFLLEKA